MADNSGIIIRNGFDPKTIRSDEEDPFANLMDSVLPKKRIQNGSKPLPNPQKTNSPFQVPIKPFPEDKIRVLEDLAKFLASAFGSTKPLKSDFLDKLKVDSADKIRLTQIEGQRQKIEKELSEIFQRIYCRNEAIFRSEKDWASFRQINSEEENTRYKKKIAKKVARLLSTGTIAKDDSSKLLRTMTSMWRNEISVKAAWTIFEDISRKSKIKGNSEKNLKFSKMAKFENKKVNTKNTGKKEESTENKSIPLEDLEEENFEGLEEIDLSLVENEVVSVAEMETIEIGQNDFNSVSGERKQRKREKEDLNAVDLTVNEFEDGLKAGAKGSEEESSRRPKRVNVKAFERILKHNLHKRDLDFTPKSEIILDDEDIDDGDKVSCKRCTYLFPASYKNCLLCGAAVSSKPRATWKCSQCKFTNDAIYAKSCMLCSFSPFLESDEE